MYRIGKRFTFQAAHHLPDLPTGHKCARPHGHGYQVEVIVAAADLVPPGFVIDFAELAPVHRYLDDRFDHRDLNEVLDEPPSSERLARHLYDWCAANLTLRHGAQVEAVRVAETGSTWAVYRPEATS